MINIFFFDLQRYEEYPNQPNHILKSAVSVTHSLGSTLRHTNASLFCFGIVSF